jgi:Holliday junction resolvase-like predicted endonuclease
MPEKKKAQTGHSNKEIARLDKIVAGHRNDANGLRFEQKVQNHFAGRGWRNLTWRNTTPHGEIDLCGEKDDGWFDTKYLLVECRNKSWVSAHEVVVFIRKVQLFCQTKPNAEAYLCYTGDIDHNAADVAERSSPPVHCQRMSDR